MPRTSSPDEQRKFASRGKRQRKATRGPGRFVFGTKAETLERLYPLVDGTEILDLLYFRAADWTSNKKTLLADIPQKFGTVALAVRSSAVGEDSADNTMAGAYRTCLDVDGQDTDAIESSIEDVIASYSGNPNDQVLIQPMLENVAVSGVIMTHDVQRGAPFYTIEYDDESGRTDSITGGTNVTKGVLVFRDADPSLIMSERVRAMVALAKELEEICGPTPLDIEFGIDRDEQMYLFQVRRIGLQKNWLAGTENRVSRRLEYIESFVESRSEYRPGIAGSRTILGVMPDWNPAEIIGTTPRPLASSTYRTLVTRRVWREARARMGYRRLPSEELMVLISGHPYIDVRNSFNSFLPEGLDDSICDSLIDAWIDRLDDHPELHDKVEFEVAQTCLNFTFDEEFTERYGGVLGTEGFRTFREAAQYLTNQNLTLADDGTLSLSLDVIDRLSGIQGRRQMSPEKRRGLEPLLHAADLIDECTQMGTLPFSIIARHAFIAEALLRSAVHRHALAPERLILFRRTIRSITSELTSDFNAVCRDEMNPAAFHHRYGHLRPGTYDITSLRYDERDDLFADNLPFAEMDSIDFKLSPAENNAINALLAEAGLQNVDAVSLLEYARRAIAGREDAKFVFTRSLSDALSAIGTWGDQLGLSRDDLSYVPLDEILNTMIDAVLEDSDVHFMDLAEEGRRSVALAEAIKLSYLIRDKRDIYVVPLHRSAPNFIGDARIEGQTILLDTLASTTADLFGKIVCIENADPGYDWIFAKGIRGLVTKFGGANSHMAIRCAEFGLPAAIGCGEQTFERLVAARRIELNAGEKVLRPVDAT
jgi:hypothetical protein